MTDDILVSNASEDAMKVSIDQQTNHVLKKAYRAIGEEGLADEEEFSDDYREVYGVKTSYHVVTHRNGGKYAEVTHSEVAINAEVDESIFKQ